MVLIIVAPLRKYAVHYHKSPHSTKERGKALRLHGYACRSVPLPAGSHIAPVATGKTTIGFAASDEKRINIP